MTKKSLLLLTLLVCIIVFNNFITSSAEYHDENNNNNSPDSIVFSQLMESSSSESLEHFMKDVAKYLEKPYSAISKYTKTLKNNWFNSVDSLRGISKSEWGKLNFPMGLVDAIHTLLGDCSTNSDCNNRGTCKTNPNGHRGKCLCNSGFTGVHCQNKQKCHLPCEHGGKPNQDCSACEGCLGAWSGTLCNDYDYKVPLSKLKPQILDMAKNSTEHQHHIQKKRPLPANIGVGVDITTGQLRLPVVKLTYDNPSKTWTNAKGETFRIPEAASFHTMPTGIYNPKTQSFVFTGMTDYVDQQFSWSTDLKTGSTGMFANNPNLDSIYKKYFSGDELLTVTQQFYPIFKLVLPTDSNGNPTYSLDDHAKQALDFLPPDATTDTNKKLYQIFVESWGTSFTTTAVDGGITEIRTIYDSSLLSQNLGPGNKPFSKKELAEQANRDFICQTNTGACHSINQNYKQHRKLDATTCYGGNPAACKSHNFTKWAETIQYDTSILMYGLSNNGALVQDPKKRANIQQTIQEYIAEQEKKAKHQKTCPKCSSHGHCKPPQDHCTCDGPHFTGRTCSKCISGWSGSDCNTPVCHGGCGHGKCVSPGQCKCHGHFTGEHCNKCKSGWSGSDCNDPVCPGGCKHGKCVSPGQCKCQSRWTGDNCDQCIDGWHGSNCEEGKTCYRCHGSGEVCDDAGCNFGHHTCPACHGSGEIPTNVQECFRCHGAGEVCRAAGCTYGHVTCPGCSGNGYVPDAVHECPKCHGRGEVCRPAGCSFGEETCPKCRGKGWVK